MSTSGRLPATVRKVDDRRVSRTRRSIDEAFLALLERRGYDAVAVSDIVRAADVGRATFYEHYASKDELLRAQLRHVSTLLRAGDAPSGFLDATPLFAHVRDVPLLYRLIAGRSAAVRSLRILQEVLQERVERVLDDHVHAGASLRAPLTPAIAARVVVASLAALLAWWTETGMATRPDEMQRLFVSCVGPMLDGAVTA
jgi:AcrR family transcriptional regulator